MVDSTAARGVGQAVLSSIAEMLDSLVAFHTGYLGGETL